MTISIYLVRARKRHYCWNCGKPIEVGQDHISMYGSSDDACKNPPPSTLRECVPCRTYFGKYMPERRPRRVRV